MPQPEPMDMAQFVGGPWDGKRMLVPRGLAKIVMPLPVRIPPIRVLRYPVPTPDAFATMTYRRNYPMGDVIRYVAVATGGA